MDFLKMMQAAQQVSGKMRELQESLADAERSIDAEIDQVVASRQPLVDAVSATLITEYERIRGGAGGVGVARLQGATCLGCHISLAAAEVDVLKRLPADEPAHCPDCGRLLVR